MDSGPIYFFDQWKPERRKWNKEAWEQQFSYLKDKSGEKEKKSKALENTLALAGKEFYPIRLSEVPKESKLPSKHKLSKVYWEKNLLEEYKLTAPEILCELEKILQKYVEQNITFPVGLVNLMNYTWEDLIEGASKYIAKTSTSLEKVLQGNSSTLTKVDSKGGSNPSEEFNKENSLVKATKYNFASSRSMEKISFINHNQYSRISQESSLPLVIHFSLSSKFCLESGWIFHHPFSNLEILKWKTVLSTAVERLQAAIIQIKMEEAKLKKVGFNKQLILSHYNDPEGPEDHSTQGPQSFWLELLERKPQMPIVREANPQMKKFHYALKDGSSLTSNFIYPSGRLAVCQSYSDLPWGGVYTNIFSDVPNPVILGTFTPFGCGSVSFPKRKIIAMMFNQDGGMVISKSGKIVREWMWPSKGKLDDPVEIGVNKFITVKISGRCAITLVYQRHPQSLTLSLAPMKCKPFPQCLSDALFPDINSISREARELLKNYKIKCKQLGLTAENKNPSSSEDPANKSTFDPVVDISPMHDIATAINLRSLQRKVKHVFLHWLNHYRLALGLELLHICKLYDFPLKVRKQMVSSANVSLKEDAKKKENKEFLRYRNNFLKLKGAFQPSPLHRIHRTPATTRFSRLTLPTESKDVWFAPQLICPVVLRRALCGKEGQTCRCSSHSIPEVTDLEYDNLISKQLSSVDQTVIVCVSSAKEKNKTIKEVSELYRELNRSRNMPCIQSRLDSFRLLKYDITSASKLTGGSCPILVRRHNVIPGIFLMYIRGKLLFANFIFNGYSTSAKDLQKQILKTRNDYHMGYFLPSDYRIREVLSVNRYNCLERIQWKWRNGSLKLLFPRC